MTSDIFEFLANLNQKRLSPREASALAAARNKRRLFDIKSTLQNLNKLEKDSRKVRRWIKNLSDGKNLQKKTMTVRLQEQEMMGRMRLFQLFTARYIQNCV